MIKKEKVSGPRTNRSPRVTAQSVKRGNLGKERVGNDPNWETKTKAPANNSLCFQGWYFSEVTEGRGGAPDHGPKEGGENSESKPDDTTKGEKQET